MMMEKRVRRVVAKLINLNNILTYWRRANKTQQQAHKTDAALTQQEEEDQQKAEEQHRLEPA